MSTQSVRDLLGEQLYGDVPLGENMTGPDLTAGYIPDRTVEHVPPMQLGDGLAGPPNDQQLQIFRDDRPIATDELGMQGPFHLTMGTVARHRAGRRFPLNFEFDSGLDHTNPGMLPQQDTRRNSPLSPGEQPLLHDGVPAVELIPGTRTVYYTASPNVGWTGY